VLPPDEPRLSAEDFQHPEGSFVRHFKSVLLLIDLRRCSPVKENKTPLSVRRYDHQDRNRSSMGLP